MELDRFKSVALPLRGKLMGIAVNLLENKADAEDVVQDAFLKLWRIREQLDGYRSVEALAVTVVKRLAIDSLRRRRGEEIWRESVEIPADTDSRENASETKDAVERIRTLIERLPPLQQSIIRMKDVEEYEMTEIAEIIGCTPEAVRVNLSRARKKIREQFLMLNKGKL